MSISRLISPRRAAACNVGVGSPGSIANLAGWWDASAAGSLAQNSNGTTAASAANDPVGYWADQSGNGRNLTQSTSNNRPLLVLNAINGFSALSFDGVNDTLGASFTLTQPCHHFIVFKTNATYVSGNPRIFDGWDQAAGLLRDSTPKMRAFYGNAYSDANTLLANISEDDIQTFLIWETLVDGTSSRLRRNGVAADCAKNVGTNAPNGIRLAVYFNGFSNPGNISIAEVLVYSRILSSGESTNVRRYLSLKYRLSMV